MRWAGQVTRVGEMRNTYRILVRRDHLGGNIKIERTFKKLDMRV
jgi:hypothetical protein